eukprot:TRINITY_DN17863_c0_g1_i2.p1 TRINITY_DN17863_c0_g1~~TRINITY_DN17863_c0_g1_i2.p1  ORF type:complete len:824 (-),score=133.80 TRINITY_DN17863_c0_g1_i2:158-2587(-)
MVRSCRTTPTPFCEVQLPWLCRHGGENALDTCILCCQERPKYSAVGRCGHDICWICSIRLRALQHDFRCPVCKEELVEVALVTRVSPDALQAAKAASSSRKSKQGSVANFGFVYGSADVAADVEALFDYSCWMQGCEILPGFTSLKSLENHLLTAHGRRFCGTCLYDRKVFLHEQILYVPDDLDRHQREGDSSRLLGSSMPSSPPHAYCNFCKESLYSKDDLLDHMNVKHHHCGLCQRQGRPFEYYNDFASLSKHYEEEHYVCMHEDCRKGSYRLVAFLREDELRIHEATEHMAKSAKAAQRARKQGVRLNLQIGAPSYRDEQEQRRQTAAASRQGMTAAEVLRNANIGDDIRIRFMKPRGQPARPSADDEEVVVQKTLSAERAERYPPKAKSAPRRPNASVASDRPAPADVASSSLQARGAGAGRASAKGAAAPPPPPPGRPRESVVDIAARGTLARLLALALRELEEVGVDAVEALTPAEYKERNKMFKAALQNVLGEAQLQEFKELSATFRRTCAEKIAQGVCGEDVAAYVEDVCKVFGQAREAAGRVAAARLLSDLVVLLPEPALRHSLHQQLIHLRDREGRTEAAALKAASLPPSLEELDCSAAFQGETEGTPQFLSAFSALLSVVVKADEAQNSVRTPALAGLRRLVQSLETQKAKSLSAMQQHLGGLAAKSPSGRPLDFSVAERVLALQPSLQLKLKGGYDSAAWREWKVAAAAVIYGMPVDERRYLLEYVRLCEQRVAETTHTNVVLRASPAVERSAEESFPELAATTSAAPRVVRSYDDSVTAGQGKRKGRQRQVLQAWG